jgi:hypothetical protein
VNDVARGVVDGGVKNQKDDTNPKDEAEDEFNCRLASFF